MDLNGKQAAIRCGTVLQPSLERTACELLASRKVSAVAEGQRLKTERTGRTVAAVMADIGRVRDDAMQEVTDPETGSRAMLSHKRRLEGAGAGGRAPGRFEDRTGLSNPDGTLRPQVIKIIAA